MIGHREIKPITNTTFLIFGMQHDSGNLPSVSYLKAPAYQDGHAGYSNPLDEQTFVVDTMNQDSKTC